MFFLKSTMFLQKVSCFYKMKILRFQGKTTWPILKLKYVVDSSVKITLRIFDIRLRFFFFFSKMKWGKTITINGKRTVFGIYKASLTALAIVCHGKKETSIVSHWCYGLKKNEEFEPWLVFGCSALRNVVENPSALAILPLSVLGGSA